MMKLMMMRYPCKGWLAGPFLSLGESLKIIVSQVDKEEELTKKKDSEDTKSDSESETESETESEESSEYSVDSEEEREKRLEATKMRIESKIQVLTTRCELNVTAV